MHRIVRSYAFLLILLSGTAWGNDNFAPISPGIERATVKTQSGKDAPPMNVWVYRPLARANLKSLPCVLIAASGAIGPNGAALNDDLVAEHLPFAEQGCIVVAYDVDGVISGDTNPNQYIDMIRAFMKSEGGVANAHAALDAAIKLDPSIDTGRLIAAGHGSAANVALLLAAKEARIRAVVAFSPLGNVIENAGDISTGAIDTALPGYKDFLTQTQPLAIADQIHCPTLLFHPSDDPISPIAPTHKLVEKMKAAGNDPELDEPKTGGHVEAMLNTGLKRAATWVGELSRRMPTTSKSN